MKSLREIEFKFIVVALIELGTIDKRNLIVLCGEENVKFLNDEEPRERMYFESNQAKVNAAHVLESLFFEPVAKGRKRLKRKRKRRNYLSGMRREWE